VNSFDFGSLPWPWLRPIAGFSPARYNTTKMKPTAPAVCSLYRDVTLFGFDSSVPQPLNGNKT